MATILIVDDRPVSREFLVTLLGYRGHRLLEATDGEEALARVRTERPDLIISDILMPTMDGFEFVRQLRTDPANAHTPVIFYTAAYHEQAAYALAHAYGVSSVLYKPCEAEEILRTVDAALGLPSVDRFEKVVPEAFDHAHLRLVTDKLAKSTTELEYLNLRLQELLQLGQQLALEPDTLRLLDTFCQASRRLIGAKYAALAVLDDDGQTLRHFLTSGLDPETVARIGAPPRRLGVLGQVVAEERPVRIKDLEGYPQAAGFPEHHPCMRSFLGVRIASPTKVYGLLYLADKLGADEFSEADEQLVITLASQVALAYENARRYDEIRRHSAELEREVAERRQAEAASQAERDRLLTTLTSIGDAAIVTDAQGRIDFINSVAQSLTGWTQPEAVGQPLEEVFHIINEYTREPADHPVRKVLETGVIVGLANHTVLIARNGTELPIDDSAAPIRTRGGEILGVILIFRDITERREAEEALRMGKERLKLAQSAAHTGAWDWDMRTGELSWSAESYLLLGLKPGEHSPSYKHWLQAVHPDERAWVKEALSFMVEHKKDVLDLEYRIVHPDGSIRWLNDRGRVFYDEAARPVRMIGISIDITERKRIEAALRESEAHFRSLAETVPDIVWIHDPEHGNEYLNPKWYAYSGQAPEEGRRLGWTSVIHPDDLEPMLESWQHTLETGAPYQIEARYRRRDGVYRWFLIRAHPMRDEQGRIVKWFGASTDIDDRKQMESALKEADNRKDEFLATLAHELRNPLTPIRNVVAALQRMPLDNPAIGAACTMVDRQVEHLTRLVDDLLDVSRITRGKMTLRKTRCELVALLQEAGEDHRSRMEEHGLTFILDLPGHPLWMQGDRTRLAQMVSNLLHNARKFTPWGGVVTVGLSLVSEPTAPGQAALTVRDTGIGIESELLPHIFEPFRQLPQGVDRGHGGLGLGLALVRSIVDLHGGEVTAESAGPGQGTALSVRLPLEPEAPLPLAGEMAAPPAPNALRVLLIEDNEDVAESTAILIELMGHRVQVARDGAEGLAVAPAFRPEVVLCDIGLPGEMDGYAVARRLRQDPELASVYLVALTGYGHEAARERTRSAGFDRHVSKPFKAACLEELLTARAEGREMAPGVCEED